jgi:hypothetical protein
MQIDPYLAAWLCAALTMIAALSWVLTRAKRTSDQRREDAQRLLHALERYSTWVCAQRLNAVFRGESPEAAAALDEACAVRQAGFPALAGDMAELLAVHNRLLNFLSTQQTLWQQDPENWLESDHDTRFMALWRQHRRALQALQGKLERATSLRIPTSTAPRRESTYA